MSKVVLRDNKLNLRNILFISLNAIIGILGFIYVLFSNQMTPTIWAMFIFYVIATGMGITVGYHRLFSHRTYDANKLVEFLLLFFGAAAFEQSCMEWSSDHRIHHRFVDTDQDPYNIKKGFFWAHIGWLFFGQNTHSLPGVSDLKKNKLVAHQNKYYKQWAIFAGILFPILVGLMLGQNPLVVFFVVVCMRITLVYQFTFFINSICHMFGKSTFDVDASAKDNWMIAFLTFGEGYHNFHHKFPGDYRNGIRWFDFDPSKWVIWALSKIGWTYNLKTVSNFRIWEARLAGHKDELLSVIEKKEIKPTVLQKQVEKWNQTLGDLKLKLSQWETASREYHKMLKQKISNFEFKDPQLIQKALHEMEEKKRNFVESYHKWVDHFQPQALV